MAAADTRLAYEVARLLSGLPPSGENGLPPPWPSLLQQLYTLPLGERIKALEAEGRAQPGLIPEGLVERAVALDPHAPCPPHDETDTTDFVGSLPVAVPFPLECLPEPLRSFVKEGAASLGCPPDYIAVPLLTCAGAAIGTSCRLQIKPGWYEWPLLYTLVIGPSGARKTPGKHTALRFTHEQGLKFQQGHVQNLENFERLMAEYQQAKEDRSRGTNKAELPPLPDKPLRPVLKRAWLNDATMEAVGQRLQENPRGLLLARDELAGLLLGFNQYRGGRGADLQNILSLWSVDPITIDRKSEADPIVLPQPFMAITGGVQPGLLAKVFGGDRLFDGFSARFLMTHPEPMPYTTTDEVIRDQAMADMSQVFKTLYTIVHHDPYAIVPEPQLVRLSSSARSLFATWERRIGSEIDSLGEDDPLRAPLSKMPGQVARLALIIHVVRWAAKDHDRFEDLDEATMRMALGLGDYFAAHARKVWSQLTESAEDSQIRRVLSWMRKQGRPVTKREVQRAGVGGLKNALQVDALIRDLLGCALLERTDVGRTERYILRKGNHD